MIRIAYFFRAVSINVYLGAHNIDAWSESSRIMYTTSTYYKNPGWLQQNVTADIALVKLPTPININGNFFSDIFCYNYALFNATLFTYENTSMEQ